MQHILSHYNAGLTTSYVTVTNTVVRLDSSTNEISSTLPINTCSNNGAPSVSSEADSVWSLPPYCEFSAPNFLWDEVDSETFSHSLESCYLEVVHWKRYFFRLPFGHVGNCVVKELTRLFNSFANASALESVALKAAVVLPSLLLQRTHAKSKAKEDVVQLERRLKLWLKGDLNTLLVEDRAIQHLLSRKRTITRTRSASMGEKARIFAKLMMEGKVKSALRMIANDECVGVLPLTDEVLQSLKGKHPTRNEAIHTALVAPNSPPELVPNIILFDTLNAELIRKVSMETEGAAGPSDLDATAWRHLCCSFQSSFDLCAALASVAKRICATFIDPKCLSAFVACRLVPLDKCPGVRPIGIGETIQRIIGKAILATIGQNIIDAAGPLQLCVGQQAGCEAAVHAMSSLYDSQTTEAILLVDALNSLNREVALRNIQHLCPSLSVVLINTYREDIDLFVDGATLLSTEGTTQGDPLAMAMYGIGILPLIKKLQTCDVTQTWLQMMQQLLGQQLTFDAGGT